MLTERLCSRSTSSCKKTKVEVKNTTKKAPKTVTTTISPLRSNSRENVAASPKPGPSRTQANPVSSDEIAAVVKDETFSDEENNLPEHLVIPSDPNSIEGNC